MSKVIKVSLIRCVISFELFILHHTFNKSDSKLKPTVTCSMAFSCTSRFLVPEFILSCHWLLVLFTFVLIGRFNQVAFRFATLSQKDLGALSRKLKDDDKSIKGV